MGYARGKKWTDEEIIDRIQEVIDKLDLKTFPTKSEMNNYYKNSGLSGKVSKSGGTKYWATRLNIPLKDCESKTGEKFEQYCLATLIDMGYSVESMKPRYAYDLLVNENIKVDVKSAYIYNSPTNFKFYTFNLEKSAPTCDIYVAYCLNDDGVPEKTYIIPSKVLSGKTQLSVGENSSKYNKYINNWELFRQYDEFYESLQ